MRLKAEGIEYFKQNQRRLLAFPSPAILQNKCTALEPLLYNMHADIKLCNPLCIQQVRKLYLTSAGAHRNILLISLQTTLRGNGHNSEACGIHPEAYYVVYCHAKYTGSHQACALMLAYIKNRKEIRMGLIAVVLIWRLPCLMTPCSYNSDEKVTFHPNLLFMTFTRL